MKKNHHLVATMSRHKRHIRLLNHLASLGYNIIAVSNAQNTCRAKVIRRYNNKLIHVFGLSRRFLSYTPPIVPFKGCSWPYLCFDIIGKDGEKLCITGWRDLALLVEELELEKNQKPITNAHTDNFNNVTNL